MVTDPLYQRIASNVRERIRSGEWAVGSKLPGRALLAKEYRVALPTIERAIGQLLATGEVIATRRSGTVVARAEPADAGAAPSAPAAAGLRLGLMAPAPPDDTDAHHIHDPRIAAIIAGMERTLADANGELQFRNLFHLQRQVGDHTTGAQTAAAELVASGATALCLANPYGQADLEQAARVLADVVTVPWCYLSTHHIRLNAAQVRMELDAGATQAGQHLRERGYRRIIYLAPWQADWVHARRTYLEQALTAGETFRSIDLDHTTVHLRHQQSDVTELAIQAALQEIPDVFTARDPWAIVCPNGGIAVQVHAAAVAAGRIPGTDVGILALDDDARAFALGLTVLSPPLEELGAAAVHAAAVGSGTRLVHPRLVARASTRRR